MDTAMLAAVSGLSYTLSTLLKLEGYLSYVCLYPSCSRLYVQAQKIPSSVYSLCFCFSLVRLVREHNSVGK